MTNSNAGAGVGEIEVGSHEHDGGGENYFSAVETEVNMPFTTVPRPVTTGTMAKAMPAAIRLYSIAVAAVSSLKNAASFSNIAVL